MIIRIFRARPKPGMADALTSADRGGLHSVRRLAARLARTVHGRGMGSTGDELIMISVWEGIEALKNMTGDNWEDTVIPDQREADRIAESSVRHYRSVDFEKV